VFLVRYGLDVYMLIRRNSVSTVTATVSCFVQDD
jgi:hypothetical protein